MSVLCGNRTHTEPTYHENAAAVRACYFPGVAQTPTTTRPRAPRATPFAVAPRDLRDGIYTVRTLDGHRTFKVETQPSDADFAPGKQVVSYLVGSDNETAYKSMAFITDRRDAWLWRSFQGTQHTILKEAFHALVTDPDTHLEAANCYRCGRLLTTPESIATGWGPVCASKGLR